MEGVAYVSERTPAQIERRASVRASRRHAGAEHALIYEPMRSMRCTYMGRL
jgi:hypothetical protein